MKTKICIRCDGEYPATEEFFNRHNQKNDGLRPECRECRNKHRRQRYLKNRKKILEQNSQWAKENREYALEYQRRWVKENREHVLEYKRQWAKENREHVRKIKRQWREENPEKVRATRRRRRARKLKAGGNHAAEDVQLIGERQRWKCWWCGKKCKDQYEVDHRIPLSRGGGNGPGNLVIACQHCNRSKGAKMPHEFKGRLL